MFFFCFPHPRFSRPFNLAIQLTEKPHRPDFPRFISVPNSLRPKTLRIKECWVVSGVLPLVVFYLILCKQMIQVGQKRIKNAYNTMCDVLFWKRTTVSGN